MGLRAGAAAARAPRRSAGARHRRCRSVRRASSGLDALVWPGDGDHRRRDALVRSGSAEGCAPLGSRRASCRWCSRCAPTTCTRAALTVAAPCACPHAPPRRVVAGSRSRAWATSGRPDLGSGCRLRRWRSSRGDGVCLHRLFGRRRTGVGFGAGMVLGLCFAGRSAKNQPEPVTLCRPWRLDDQTCPGGLRGTRLRRQTMRFRWHLLATRR